ncbi:MAG: hypothetical protein GXO48_08775, partial [Chlorobi bacterium]|nr:hypothetical protein [Chlorobiota bacterium]
NDWHKPCNWDLGRVPTCNDTVYIPSVSTSYPVISGIAHSKEINITTGAPNALTINSGARLDISSGGGSCSGTPTDNSGTLSPPVKIQGNKYSCNGDRVVWKAPHPTGQTWTWQYPPSWSFVHQSGDSIVLVPRGNGQVKVTVCDNNCNCASDSITLTLSSCSPMCFSIGVSGSNKVEGGHGIIQTKDGSIVMVGETNSFGNNKDMYVVKLDLNGNVLWTKVIGGPNTDVAYQVKEDNSGNLVIVGYTYSNTHGLDDIAVLKLAPNGNVLWAKAVGTPARETAYGLWIDNNDDIYIAGYHYNNTNPNGYEALILKISPSGNIIWSTTVGKSGFEEARTLCVKGTEVYVGGTTSSVGSGKYDLLIMRLNKSSGNLVWSKTYGSADFDYMYTIVPFGNDLLLGAAIDSPLRGTIIQFTTAGTPTKRIWMANSTMNIHVKEIVSTGDGGVAAVAIVRSTFGGIYPYLITKFNASLSLQWQHTVGNYASSSQPYHMLSYYGNSITIIGNNLLGVTTFLTNPSSSTTDWNMTLTTVDWTTPTFPSCSQCQQNNPNYTIANISPGTFRSWSFNSQSISLSIKNWAPSVSSGGTPILHCN